jgi:hypothetical protein
MKLLLVFWSILLAVSVSEGAGNSLSETCIKSLSQGRNRLRVKVNATALRNLRDGLVKYSDYLKDDSEALLIDYSLNSKVKRAFLVDFKSCDILANEYVIHGGVVYHPVVLRDGDANDDGMLDKCINRHGNTKNMTRPGFAVTAGCHQTKENGWTKLNSSCQGVTLMGLDKSNQDILRSGVVLHEHLSIPDDTSIKPVGQGCPAFPPGRLKSMLGVVLMKGFLVYTYAPQCGA